MPDPMKRKSDSEPNALKAMPVVYARVPRRIYEKLNRQARALQTNKSAYVREMLEIVVKAGPKPKTVDTPKLL